MLHRLGVTGRLAESPQDAGISRSRDARQAERAGSSWCVAIADVFEMLMFWGSLRACIQDAISWIEVPTLVRLNPAAEMARGERSEDTLSLGLRRPVAFQPSELDQ